MDLDADANDPGSLGRNLHNAYNVNRYAGDTLDGRFNGFNPSFATINHVMSTSKSDYDGLSLSIRRPFRNSYMFSAVHLRSGDGRHRPGRRRDEHPGRRKPRRRMGAGRLRRDAQALLRRDVGAALFRNSAGLTKSLLGGWQLQGYGVFQTGNPISVTNSAAYPAGDYNADNNAGDRPDAPSGVSDRRLVE